MSARLTSEQTRTEHDPDVSIGVTFARISCFVCFASATADLSRIGVVIRRQEGAGVNLFEAVGPGPPKHKHRLEG